MLWTKQYYHYVIAEWLEGDPAQPPPPASRRTGRNASWKHLFNRDVITMPDTWEFPWYASWDLGFHCVTLAHVDPQYAKDQIVLMLREWYMHPNGQLPAYEWNFDDVNPPVLSLAARTVFEVEHERTGVAAYDFLERVFHKLMLNFTWWVNRKDALGNDVFEGGFLGMDNISAFDRDNLPPSYLLGQVDGTSWMAAFAKSMFSLALTLAQADPVYEDLASKFWEHYIYIANALNSLHDPDRSLWDERDGFFYDVLLAPDAPGRRSAPAPWSASCRCSARPRSRPVASTASGLQAAPPMVHRPSSRSGRQRRAHGGAGSQRLGHHGAGPLRSASAHGGDAAGRRRVPVALRGALRITPSPRRAARHHRSATASTGSTTSPASRPTTCSAAIPTGAAPSGCPSTTCWYGPCEGYHQYFGDTFQVECPTGSGRRMTLDQVARDLARRLARIFLRGADGRRPVSGPYHQFDEDPHWRDLIPFHEYFHGDTGRGCGASHQTGWTGLIADLIIRFADEFTSEDHPS